jgi:hypothetical protein
VSPVKYKLWFYSPEDDILHSHRREDLTAYIGVNSFGSYVITVAARVAAFLLFKMQPESPSSVL